MQLAGSGVDTQTGGGKEEHPTGHAAGIVMAAFDFVPWAAADAIVPLTDGLDER